MNERQVRMLHERYRKAIEYWMEPWIESCGTDIRKDSQQFNLYSDRDYFTRQFDDIRQMQRFVEYEARVEGGLRNVYLQAVAAMDQFAASMVETSPREHKAGRPPGRDARLEP